MSKPSYISQEAWDILQNLNDHKDLTPADIEAEKEGVTPTYRGSGYVVPCPTADEQIGNALIHVSTKRNII